MAKYKCVINSNIYDFLQFLDLEILKGSISATFVDGSDFVINDIHCITRVYERYSYIGKNRVSLGVTLVGTIDNFNLCAITSGGSQAVFIKINTFGEEAFLEKIREVVVKYKPKQSNTY